MGRNLCVTFSAAALAELEWGYRHGSSHAFRQRCRMVLLKSQGFKTKDICPVVGIKSQNQVNVWIKRYKAEYAALGINVLHNAQGQGRKPIFDQSLEAQTDRIKEVVKSERQRLHIAQEIISKELDKRFHVKTLQRFLKNLTADMSACDGA